MDDLVKVHANEVVSQDSDGDKVHLEKSLSIESSVSSLDVKGFVNKIFQYVDIASVINKVEKGAEYVVQIPAEFQGGFKAGDYWIMENKKTGNLWPTLMKLGDDGKNQIVTPLAIKKEEFLQGNPIKDIANDYNNIILQQKLNEIAGMLEETIDAVRRIEQGQKDDRIGLLESGKQGLLLALNQKDVESRKTALLLARNDINTAQAQIFQTFETKVAAFKPLPSTKPGLYVKEFFSTDSYLNKRDDEYDEILDYYHLYVDATQMLAGSYVVVDDMENAQRVLDLGIKKLESLDYSNLKTIEYIHKDADFERIYDVSSKYLLEEKKDYLNSINEYDYLSISIKGDDLLEAITNEREKCLQEVK